MLERVEQSYNTFRQMGIEEDAHICLWLPNCPDLLCSFYALSRLGAVPVLAHPKASAVEIFHQMQELGCDHLITTPERYEAYCSCQKPLPESKLSLCRPEKDMKGAALKGYLSSVPRPSNAPEKGYFDQQMAKNRYHANEPAFCDGQKAAVLLVASSSFLKVVPVRYLANELAAVKEEFFRHREQVESVYVGLSFAFEGGFLASHSALCTGRQLLWGEGDAVALLKKYQPDLVIGSEEFFWELRQRSGEFRGRWENLQGGIQMGRSITPLGEKFTPLALEETGGRGIFTNEPLPLKIRREELYYAEDFGIRIGDIEKAVSCFSGVEKCRCIAENGGLRLQVKTADGGDAEAVRTLIAYCREEIGALNLPRKVELV